MRFAAKYRKLTTSRIATTGRVMASTERSAEPPASAVASTGLPRPPVAKEEMCRAVAVKPWNTAVVPPPATTASVHLRNGLTSPSEEAVTRTPATTAVGVAMASSRLSTQGM
jgi:hypothetical protein